VQIRETKEKKEEKKGEEPLFQLYIAEIYRRRGEKRGGKEREEVFLSSLRQNLMKEGKKEEKRKGRGGRTLDRLHLPLGNRYTLK